MMVLSTGEEKQFNAPFLGFNGEPRAAAPPRKPECGASTKQKAPRLRYTNTTFCPPVTYHQEYSSGAHRRRRHPRACRGSVVLSFARSERARRRESRRECALVLDKPVSIHTTHAPLRVTRAQYARESRDCKEDFWRIRMYHVFHCKHPVALVLNLSRCCSSCIRRDMRYSNPDAVPLTRRRR